MGHLIQNMLYINIVFLNVTEISKFTSCRIYKNDDIKAKLHVHYPADDELRVNKGSRKISQTLRTLGSKFMTRNVR